MNKLKEKLKEIYSQGIKASSENNLIKPLLKRVMNSINRKEIYNFLNNIRKPEYSNVLKRSAAVFIAIVIISGGALYYHNLKNEGYTVKYNGKLLGYVKDKGLAIQAFDSLKEELKSQDPYIVLDSGLDFEKTSIDSNEQAFVKDIKEQIKSELYKEFTSYLITVNGKEIVYVASEDEAKKAVESVKKYFADKEEKNGAEILGVSIKDDIQIVSKVADMSKAVDVQKAVDTLIGTTNITKQYEVKEGDSLWTIARNNNMKVDDIASVNPGLDVELLQPGQVINLSANAPNINVEVTYKQESEEKVAFGTEYTNDSNLYKGQSKVVQSGQNGIKKVLNQITKLNGLEISKTLLTSSIVKNPVAQIVAKGTKNLVGIGAFLWPTRGNLTSGFGSRGGEYHKGLDIAAPQGTPIYAADGGTVVHAGWYYGYGNLVIIDHGNGFETYYGHCSTINVKSGQSVSRGQTIASVGHTGDAYGNHVHFEVRLNGVPQNPSKYVSR